VKQWLRQNLGPAKLAEFEKFMASMMDDEGGEDEEPDIIPSGPRVQAKGAWNINGRRASVEGNPQALDQRPSIYDRNGRVKPTNQVIAEGMAWLKRHGYVRSSAPASAMAYDRKWPEAAQVQVEGTPRQRPAWDPPPHNYDAKWSPPSKGPRTYDDGEGRAARRDRWRREVAARIGGVEGSDQIRSVSVA